MPPLAFCGECGSKLLDGKPFCGNCGHNNAGGLATTPAKSGSGNSGNSGGGKICGGCRKTLEGVLRYTTALDKEWHVECFVCGKCRSPFEGGKFFVQNDVPICENCGRNSGPKCAGCSQPCGERYISALDKVWHHACFVCCGCGKTLGGGFITRQDKPYCESACANKQTRPVTAAATTAQVSASSFASKPQAKSSCPACSLNSGKAFCPECGSKLGGAPPAAAAFNNQNAQREQEQQRQREQQRQKEQQQQREKEQQQRQREQEQREREQQQREREQQQRKEQEQRKQEQLAREREAQQRHLRVHPTRKRKAVTNMADRKEVRQAAMYSPWGLVAADAFRSPLRPRGVCRCEVRSQAISSLLEELQHEAQLYQALGVLARFDSHAGPVFDGKCTLGSSSNRSASQFPMHWCLGMNREFSEESCP